MTRLTSTEIDCPHCGNSFRVMWEASINTWLNPELIQKLLDDKYLQNPVIKTIKTCSYSLCQDFEMNRNRLVSIYNNLHLIKTIILKK